MRRVSQPKAKAASRMSEIRRYIRERLLAEFKGKKRGAAAEASRAIGISTAHMTNMLSEKSSAGEVAARKVAAYWGMTYAQLESVACGEMSLGLVPNQPPSTPTPQPNLDTIREMLREEIRSALDERLPPKGPSRR